MLGSLRRLGHPPKPHQVQSTTSGQMRSQNKLFKISYNITKENISHRNSSLKSETQGLMLGNEAERLLSLKAGVRVGGEGSE